ncbi:Os01g0660000, partial [Oryza sativa Japonica Group]
SSSTRSHRVDASPPAGHRRSISTSGVLQIHPHGWAGEEEGQREDESPLPALVHPVWPSCDGKSPPQEDQHLERSLSQSSTPLL